MKPNHPLRHVLLSLLGISFFLMSPGARAGDQDKEGKAAEAAGTERTAKEKGSARRAQEAARRAKEAVKPAKEAVKPAKETAEGGKETAEGVKQASKKKKSATGPIQEDEESAVPEEAPEAAPQPPADRPEAPAESEAAEKPAIPAKDLGRREDAPGKGERDDGRRPARDAREDREDSEDPAPPAPVIPAQPAVPPADESKPPGDMPEVPSETLKPRDEVKPRDRDTGPAEEETPEPAPDEPAERADAEIPATEPERRAETEVTEVTREVQRELDQRKTRIEGREEAQAVIDEILGAESRISRAEIAREERFQPRFKRQRPGQERLPEASPDQRRAATTYFQQRLRGREVDGPPPEFFRRSGHRVDSRAQRVGERRVERVEFVRPRYLNEGRRYVHFDSRAAIPAILMAARAMNQVRFQPTREIAPIFYGGQDVSAPQAMPLPPENYRSDNSWVVSYPVDENSMISSENILFLQGSTQFSDPYSYEVVAVMADAMKAMPEEERFVIEGHASAEGGYDSNMALSQQRAEHIVREIVRRGVSPYRLLPVGYGESEARHPADAAEGLRSQDRRVVVFRMEPEPVAAR